MRCRFGLMVVVPAVLLLGRGTNSTLYADELTGADLFSKKWTAHDQRSAQGDGLGPMHNASSCVACHEQGGPGGGGDLEHNVDLLSVVPAKAANRDEEERFQQRLVSLHPGFAAEGGGLRANFVLHRFGPEADYYTLRAKVLKFEEPRPDAVPARRALAAAAQARRKSKQSEPVETIEHNQISVQRSQRNTPALWGAGLIDSLPEGVLKQLAEEQNRAGSEVSGRVPSAGGGGAGRFGWRGQTGSLREFVLAACANELGLQTEGHAQAANPLAPHYKGPDTDLSANDVDQLVAFVVNLPQPTTREARSASDRQMRQRGERVFERIGCGACHIRDVGRVEGLFSDLLLHDMGPAFADPVEPNPPTQKVLREVPFGYSGSGRIFVDEEVRTPELAQEWRTPPLWGIADSAPYLHDGRAATLAEAIMLHGGEAAPSARRYREMAGEDRAGLLFFLQSLVAPQPLH
jgi:CxxC motif-containing protein (DUF1111 family)